MRVKAVVIIKEGYEESGVRKSIINAINIFLSPWILSLQKQVAIDQGLSDAELAGVIRDIDGVFSVESILFQTGLTGVIADPIFTTPLNQQGRIVMPLRPSNLFVPYPTHEISFRA